MSRRLPSCGPHLQSGSGGCCVEREKGGNMEFFELVERRHSVRSFTGEPVEQAAITRILKAALSGALCEKYAQQQFHGGRGAGAYRPDSPDEGLRFGVRGEGPARNTCDGRPGTERPVGGECRHIGYLCTARCAGIGTGQLLGTCRRTAATQRGARRPPPQRIICVRSCRYRRAGVFCVQWR